MRSKRCSPHPRTAGEERSEEEERDDDGDSEEAEQNRVLGRRLAILTLAQLVHCDLQCDERAHQDVGHFGDSSGLECQEHSLVIDLARVDGACRSWSVWQAAQPTTRTEDST